MGKMKLSTIATTLKRDYLETLSGCVVGSGIYYGNVLPESFMGDDIDFWIDFIMISLRRIL